MPDRNPKKKDPAFGVKKDLLLQMFVPELRIIIREIVLKEKKQTMNRHGSFIVAGYNKAVHDLHLVKKRVLKKYKLL